MSYFKRALTRFLVFLKHCLMEKSMSPLVEGYGTTERIFYHASGISMERNSRSHYYYHI
jgi:hypothetical protein